MFDAKEVKKINDNLYEIPQSFRSDMKAPARIYINSDLLENALRDSSLEQLVNVSTLPGIKKFSLAMPDIHEGYGFPIGGVAALDYQNGVISPGGVGYDINCGVRLLLSDKRHEELQNQIVDIMNQLQRDIPSGVGRGGDLRLSRKEIDKVLAEGLSWAVKNNYAEEADQKATESNGCLHEADPAMVSERAKKRGLDQLGTLGSGNHFLELQRVDRIINPKIAKSFGLFKGQICVMIHTGSRGLGHQVCTDYVKIFNNALPKYGIQLPDRELACAPAESEEGRKYLAAMSAAANFAWCNRQLITYFARKSFNHTLRKTNKKIKLKLLYDVAHNMAKLENHLIDNKKQKVLVHRKGATRAFAPGHPELAGQYHKTGQPVLIPGSMGTSSYVLAGTEQNMEQSFGSVCHGAGRVMSRKQAKKKIFAGNKSLKKQLEERGIVVRCRSVSGLAEEAPLAYKDIDNVVSVVEKAGLAVRVAQLRPLGVLKGE